MRHKFREMVISEMAQNKHQIKIYNDEIYIQVRIESNARGRMACLIDSSLLKLITILRMSSQLHIYTSLKVLALPLVIISHITR